MTGERDLRKLLRHMTPQLHPGTFVFCSFPGDELPAGLEPIATFREAEGLSAILALDEARRAGVPHQFESGLLVLIIHSSLDAAELLAAVSALLADAGIPCNAVAAFRHDHLFVPRDMAQRAMDLLIGLAAAPAEGPRRINNNRVEGSLTTLANESIPSNLRILLTGQQKRTVIKTLYATVHAREVF